VARCGAQEEYRDVNQEFKDLGVMAERDELFSGASAPKPDDISGATNTELLSKALDKHGEIKDKLTDALRTVEGAKEVAANTAGVLEGDREKMFRITQGLDEVESELAISGKLITNFAKRLYTDKVILAFAFLLVAGIAGIIIYSTLNPNQKVCAGATRVVDRAAAMPPMRHALAASRRSSTCPTLPFPASLA